MKSPRNRQAGFTLIELPAALIIAVLLIAVLLPAVQRVRETAFDMQWNPSLAPLAAEIRELSDGSVRSAQVFLAGLGHLAADPANTAFGDGSVRTLPDGSVAMLADGRVRIDEFAEDYCAAPATYETLAARVREAAERSYLPAVQRRLLRRTAMALEGTVPVLMQVRAILSARGLCDSAGGPPTDPATGR